MRDLGAYLERIGLSGRPGVRELHRAHITSIPFENLDPQRGVPVSLAPEDLEQKLVAERRGGYCFEQNLLLRAALEELGAEVDVMLARVRWRAPAGTVRPPTHLVLRVRAGGEDLHADVGFGGGSLIEPLPWGPGEPHEQDGWRFRIVEDGRELALQVEEDGAWTDLYGFLPEPVPMADVELSNWFTSTHPSSGFVTGLIASLRGAAGALTVLSDWGELALIEQRPGARELTPVTRDQLPALLAERLGLPGWELGPEGRLVPARG